MYIREIVLENIGPKNRVEERRELNNVISKFYCWSHLIERDSLEL